MPVLIVESPAKCKTISKYLGSDFHILASYGHVRGLPSNKGSVLPDEDFKMIYDIHDDSKKHISALTQSVKNTDILYLATDPDREGEAISWHIYEILRAKKAIKKATIVKRIVFNEITKTAVLNAIKNAREIDINLVQAQQTRQALDYLVGFTLSPLLWRKLPGSRSAGRVQSVALRLICERENEIKRFISQEYWKIIAQFTRPKPFQATLISVDGTKLEKLSITKQEEADSIVARLQQQQYKVVKVEKKEAKRNPLPPFITSTLQQDAANKLGFTTKMTMIVAQKLYEGIKIGQEEVGLITYMRTDGVYISAPFIETTRTMIADNFGAEYLPSSARKYISKVKNAQEAHEAIRPTNIEFTPEKIKSYLTPEQLKLYTLIWNRMVASQMASAVLHQVSINLESIDQYGLFRATGSTIKFDGFYILYKSMSEDDEGKLLPDLQEGEVYTAQDIIPSQHFTQPPPRFTEASLVKKMEELGIGRPSTYSTIISVLQERKYVVLESKKFTPLDRGQFVTAFLTSFFKRYVEYEFTAHLEEELDQISNHELDWKTVLRDFWQAFSDNVQEVDKYKIPEILAEIDRLLEIYIFDKDEDGKIDRQCLKCDDGRLNLNIGKFGAFLGCSNYPECEYRKSIMNNNDNNDDGEYPQVIGINPDTQEEVQIKKGPYGLYLECAGKRSTLPKGMTPDAIDLSIALKLLTMPYSLGINSESNLEVQVGIGRYGPYILHDKKYTSVGNDKLFSITLAEALTAIKAKGNQSVGEYQGHEIQICKGRYGPYIKYNGENIALPKELKTKDAITYDEAVKVIDNKKK